MTQQQVMNEAEDDKAKQDDDYCRMADVKRERNAVRAENAKLREFTMKVLEERNAVRAENARLHAAITKLRRQLEATAALYDDAKGETDQPRRSVRRRLSIGRY